MATTPSIPTIAATCPPTPHRQTATAQSSPTGPHSCPRRGCPRTRVPPSRRTTCCATPPGAADGARRTRTWPARARRDRHPCGRGAATLRPGGRRWHRKQRQSRSGRGARHAAAASATDGERPSPPITEGRSGPLPTPRWTPARCTLLPSTDDEHP
jgi:hypothetical protein